MVANGRMNGMKVISPCLLLFSALMLLGQATSNSNTIQGEIRFTNTNPQVLALLQGGVGLNSWRVTANSVGVSTPYNNTATGSATDSLSTAYQIAVESGVAGSGIVYELNIWNRYHDYNLSEYHFLKTLTPPVEEEPAPPVVVDVAQCAGIFHISWVNSLGSPVSVSSGHVTAFMDDGGVFVQQARNGWLQPGTTEIYLPVRGGENFRVDIHYATTVGSDPYSDLLTFSRDVSQNHASVCDGITEIEVVVPGGDGGVEELHLGKIIGDIDVLNEVEVTSGVETALRAAEPNGNYRLDGFFGSGSFELENLIPSVGSGQGYSLRAEMFLRLGNRFTRYTFPTYGAGTVDVPPDDTVDLGNKYVMDPGYVRGDIQVAGPPPGPDGSPLEYLYHSYNYDNDGDGVPNRTDLAYTCRVSSNGVNTLAPGAIHTAYGGNSFSHYAGGYDAASQSFLGDYDLILGGLDGLASIWTAPRFDLYFHHLDQSNPDNHYNAFLAINNYIYGDIAVSPGSVEMAPQHFCLSKVIVDFQSTRPFYSPFISGIGVYQGLDFEGNAADYRCWVQQASGTPDYANAATSGQLVLPLVQGSYDLTPKVFAINDDGSVSQTELPPLVFEVGCRQVLRITTDLQISLQDLPECTASSPLLVTGAVSGGSEVVEVRASVNGVETVLCADCGLDPSYAGHLALEPGENAITISATDAQGAVASISSHVRYDGEAPVVSGCSDVTVALADGETEAMVLFEVSAIDALDGPVSVSCSPGSGSMFPLGETVVVCTASDSCGNVESCSFTVTVVEGSCGGGDVINAQQGVYFEANCLVDGYDGELGPYGGSNVSGDGFVRAGGSIEIHPGVSALDVHLVENDASGHGPAPIPAGLVNQGDLILKKNLTLLAGDYLFDDVILKSGAQLTTQGGLVRIWFKRLVVHSNVSVVPENLVSGNLRFYGRADGEDVELGSGSVFHGLIYAPGMSIDIRSNATVYGAIYGREVLVKSNARIHGDLSLELACFNP